MIFVTIGTVLPFDRIVRAMDDWASRHPEEKVVAQIGFGEFVPQHMEYFRATGADEYLEIVQAAKVIVAHAGMGSVITAQENGVPIVLMPRDMARREHTTEHQVHTAEWLKDKPGIFVAKDESELDDKIAAALKTGPVRVELSKFAPDPFVNRIRNFILDPDGKDRS